MAVRSAEKKGEKKEEKRIEGDAGCSGAARCIAVVAMAARSAKSAEEMHDPHLPVRPPRGRAAVGRPNWRLARRDHGGLGAHGLRARVCSAGCAFQTDRTFLPSFLPLLSTSPPPSLPHFTEKLQKR